mgnify:CR=1 FL=1
MLTDIPCSVNVWLKEEEYERAREKVAEAYREMRKAEIIRDDLMEKTKKHEQALEQVELSGREVIPSSKVLRIINDKGIQKQFYVDSDIPTSKFELVNVDEALNLDDYKKIEIQKQIKQTFDPKGILNPGKVFN